ncbi:hypothetical protein FRC02_007052 [Tulasnella sp. 418]|nr:hypothetical protein FRC02_007052 [Tulasnella sp. 418]
MDLANNFHFDPSSQSPSINPSLLVNSRPVNGFPTASANSPVQGSHTPPSDQQNGVTDLYSLPIFSYKRPSRRFKGSNWSPTDWMSQCGLPPTSANFSSRLDI